MLPTPNTPLSSLPVGIVASTWSVSTHLLPPPPPPPRRTDQKHCPHPWLAVHGAPTRSRVRQQQVRGQVRREDRDPRLVCVSAHQEALSYTRPTRAVDHVTELLPLGGQGAGCDGRGLSHGIRGGQSTRNTTVQCIPFSYEKFTLS